LQQEKKKKKKKKKKKTEPVTLQQKKKKKTEPVHWKKTEQPVFTANNTKLTSIEKKGKEVRVLFILNQ
jgi:hypothetical protein